MYNSKEVAAALVRVHKVTKINDGHIVRSQQIDRKDRELLIKTQWLQEIIKGWYLVVRPDVFERVTQLYGVPLRQLSLVWRNAIPDRPEEN